MERDDERERREREREREQEEGGFGRDTIYEPVPEPTPGGEEPLPVRKPVPEEDDAGVP